MLYVILHQALSCNETMNFRKDIIPLTAEEKAENVLWYALAKIQICSYDVIHMPNDDALDQ